MAIRKSKIKRETKETSVSVSLNIDGSGKTSIDTGISFIDHFDNIVRKAFHARFNGKSKVKG